MENRIEIPFDEEKFKTKEDFELMTSKVIHMLLDLDYVVKVENDGYTTSVEFGLDPNTYGGPSLQWVDEDAYIYTDSDLQELREEIEEDVKSELKVVPERLWVNKVNSYLEEQEISVSSFFIHNRQINFKELSISELLKLIEKEREF